MKKGKLHKKVVRGVMESMRERGWKVEDYDHMGFTVATDDEGELVFLSIMECFGDYPWRHVSRKEFEDAAISWLMTHDEQPRNVRCDKIDVRVATEKSGLVRFEPEVHRLF